jgi:cytidylate kinase
MSDKKLTDKFLRDMIVTVDGPAGSGKSTTAQALAGRLDLTYLDTGAMYRAVTWRVLQSGIDPEDREAVTRIADDISIEMEIRNGSAVLIVDGEPAGSEIRGPEVSGAVSPVSTHPGVRRAMVRIQRKIGNRGGIVAEGRDTGSTVFPFAHVKIFLVADVEARTQRRVNQLRQMGITQTDDEIRNNLLKRDEIDSGREHSPLVRAVGAYVVDTSEVTIEEQVAIIDEIVRKEAARLGELYIPKWKRNPVSRGHSFLFTVARDLIRLLEWLLFGIKVHGFDNLRFAENFFFASNHISYYDPPMVGSTFRRELWIVAKKELFKNPVFGWILRKVNAIPIDRQGFDRSTLKTIDKAFEAGDSVLMFPEGTRSKTGRLKEFKAGIGMIAYRSGKSIVPAYIKGTDSLMDCFLRKNRLEVRIGRAIRIPADYESDDRKRDYDTLSTMIYEAMKMLEDEMYA